MMDQTERSLVIILTMHRSGSSLSTGILQALGMSLGPFELLGANSGNPHGHFEANVILELNRSVQMIAQGFPDDVPDSPETLSRFLDRNGRWDESVEVPEELVERGRDLLRTLVDSGNIAGFKDPRTVLLWPFWQRVLDAFPSLRVVPVVLLRSPHEIAMSLFTRSEGRHGYKSSLDVTAVHLGTIGAIVENWPEPVPRVRFGGPHYESDLAEAVRQCGLSWDPERRDRLFDRSCVHHAPATIAHPAQRLYDVLCEEDRLSSSPPSNQVILEADAFAREAVYRERIESTRTDLDGVRQQLSGTQHCLQTIEQARQQAEEQLGKTSEQLNTTGQQLGMAQGQLRQAQDQLRQAQDQLQQTRGELQQAQHHYEETQTLLTLTHRSLQETREGFHRSVQENQETLRQTCEQLDAALARGDHLQARLDRYEIHPLLGPALRGRRRLVRVIDSLRTREAV
jgi:flagellar biosynthesis chaperone FliJ